MIGRDHPLRVTIAVLTFRRPKDISAAVPMLLAQAHAVNASEHTEVCVLVVDNDPAGSGVEALGQFAGPNLHCVIEARPGISAARNRAVSESAGSDLLIFIDDDERPDPQWLDQLLATQRTTGAAGVAGRVVSEFEREVDPWIVAGGFFARKHRMEVATGTRISVAATNNLLLDLRVVRQLGLKFDVDFGLSGGEDSLFTRSLTRTGHAMVWCAEATVTEVVPADRISRRWSLLRSISSGNSEARVEIRLARSAAASLRARTRYLFGGLVRLVAGCARALIGWVIRSQVHCARGLRTAARGTGMAGGALNWRYEEYGRTVSEVPAVTAPPVDALRRPA